VTALCQRLGWLCLLWPVLWLQARQVRKRAPCLPEPPGQRAGVLGSGPALRLLVAGDSGAAAVGVASQDAGLCGHLVRALSLQHTVHWQVCASNGLDSPGLDKALEKMPGRRFDIVVLSIGANDATDLQAPARWARRQTGLADLIEQRFRPGLLMHRAVPPMHACQALPQPLRWFMGLWAQQMNHALASHLHGTATRSLHWHPEQMIAAGMAEDLIHPNAQGYAAWASTLLPHILARAALRATPATVAAAPAVLFKATC
jgi:lysophospholipase L1-like esterase